LYCVFAPLYIQRISEGHRKKNKNNRAKKRINLQRDKWLNKIDKTGVRYDASYFIKTSNKDKKPSPSRRRTNKKLLFFT
jgi:hypothetical protein